MMSTIIDIAVEPPVILKPSMKIGEILSKMSEHRIRIAPVVDDRNVLVGVLSYRAILMKGVGRETKVATVMDPPYSINMNEPVDRAIAIIASWRTRDVPIVDRNGVVVGHINLDIILRYLYDKDIVPQETVEKVMSSPAITIQEWESIARARWLMLKNAFSRLPVVDRLEKVVGVISLSDIVERLYRIKLSRRKGYEWIESEESFLAAPVSNFMSSPPIVATTGSSVSDAVKLLIDNHITGVPVVKEDGHAVGVLSGIDVLKRYTEKFATVYPIEASISKAIESDEIAKVHVERIVNSYLADVSKYLNVIDFKLSAKPLKRSESTTAKDVRRMYEVSARIVTNVGDAVAKSACWDLPTCVREVMEIIGRRLRKRIEKGIQKREHHRKREVS